MAFEDLFSRLALALGIGLLIGLERGWRMREVEAGGRAAGIRTFAISGLLGGLVGAIAISPPVAGATAGGLFLATAFATYAAVIAVFSRAENQAERTLSATTAVAGMLTFALGVYALLGDVRIAAAAAVAATGILATREELHGWVEKITWVELRSGLVLLTMTFIALPIVPSEPIGPFGGLNPHEVWIIAIALAGISFGGYAAVKYMGPRQGTLLSAAAGGLVSSTAITIANARHAAAGEGSSQLLAAGVAVATTVSFLRVAAITAALQPHLRLLIAPALAAAAAAAAAFALISAFRPARAGEALQRTTFRNPFGFWSVIGLALLLGVVILLGRVVGQSFGPAVAIAGAIAVGFADVDSVTVSMARLAPATLTFENAALAIVAAATSNTLAKVVIAAVVGRGGFALRIAAMAALCLLAAGVALGLTRAFAAV